MKTVIATTTTDKYGREWIETGHMINGKWQASTLRYVTKHTELTGKIKRDYSKTRADGDGRHEICDWTITVPDGFGLEIAKIRKSGAGTKVEVLA